MRYLRRVLKWSTDAFQTQVMSRFTNPCYRSVIREVSCSRGLGNTIKRLERVKGQVQGFLLDPVFAQGLGRVHGRLLDLSNEPIHNPELQVFYKASVVYPGIGQNYTKFGTSKGQVQGFLLDLLFAQGLGRVHGSLLDPCNVLIHKPMLQVCSKGSVVYPGIGQNYKKFGTSQRVGLWISL